jgi:transposase-like protein
MTSGMTKLVSYKRHRFPPQIIAHAVWLYFRFPLSLRLVEEMLLERGIVVSYETVRRWALKWTCSAFVESGLVAIRPAFRTEPD